MRLKFFPEILISSFCENDALPRKQNNVVYNMYLCECLFQAAFGGFHERIKEFRTNVRKVDPLSTILQSESSLSALCIE